MTGSVRKQAGGPLWRIAGAGVWLAWPAIASAQAPTRAPITAPTAVPTPVPTTASAGAMTGDPATLDPNAPLAPMPDLGVAWPDLTGPDVAGPDLAGWPLTLKEMQPWYDKAKDKLGVTRSNGIPGLPGNNNYKVPHAGAKQLGCQNVHTGNVTSTACREMAADAACKWACAFRSAKAALNAARWTPKYRPPNKPAIST